MKQDCRRSKGIISAMVLAVLVLLMHTCAAQNLIVNQQTSSLLRATIPNEITVAIDSSYLPTFGYALLANSSSSGNNGNNNGNNGNSFGNLKDARRMPRSTAQTNSGSYTGSLGNLMFVFQLQHIWELRSNGFDWENFIVGNDTGLANSISQFALSVNNQTGNIVSVNPASVPFTLNSQNNLLTYNGLINRADLINAYNGAVSFANNNNNNDGDNDSDNDNNVSASASAGSSGANSNANVANSKRSTQQSSSSNGNNNGLRPVVSFNTVMNQSFITTTGLNPATRYIAHCYKASILDLNNGNEQNALVFTPQSQLMSQQASSAAGANAGFNTGSSASASTSGISFNSGSNVGASASGSSSSGVSSSVLGGTNNSMIAFISPLFASSLNELAYLRVIPQNINLTNNPLGGTLVTVQRGNLDTSIACVIIPRTDASSFVYNMELGFVNNNGIVGAAVNGAASGFSYSYVLLVGLFIALVNML